MPGAQESLAATAACAVEPNIVKQIVTACALGACTWLLAKAFLTPVEGSGARDNDRQQRKGAYARLRIPARNFTPTERDLVEQALLFPEDVVCVSEQELIGPVMERVLKQTQQLIKLSLHVPSSNRETVFCQSRGILLHGQPGTGKTTVAKIVARENKCFFLNITADLLRHKEYGKTEKVVAAIFSVAAKLWRLQKGSRKRPTIIFMDEVDNILGGKEHSHEAYLAARSIFAQKWDGIQKTPGMIVIGTTNYQDQLPAFIYRRFTTRTRIPLPDKASREAILRRFVVYGGYELGEIRDNKVMASEQQLSEYVDSSLLSATVLQQAPHSDETIAPIISQLKFVLSYKVKHKIADVIHDSKMHPLEKLAELTEGYSGSDLKDVVHHGSPEIWGTLAKVTEATLLSGLTKVHAHANSVQARTRDPVEAATGPSAHVYPVTVSGVGHSMQSIPRALGMAALPKRKQTKAEGETGVSVTSSDPQQALVH